MGGWGCRLRLFHLVHGVSETQVDDEALGLVLSSFSRIATSPETSKSLFCFMRASMVGDERNVNTAS